MGQAAEWSRTNIGDRTLRWSRPPVRTFPPRPQERGGRPQGTEAETGIELMLQRLPPFPQCQCLFFRKGPASPEQAFDEGKAFADRAQVSVATKHGPTLVSRDACDRNTREDDDEFAYPHRSTTRVGHQPTTFGRTTPGSTFGTTPSPSVARFVPAAWTKPDLIGNRRAKPAPAPNQSHKEPTYGERPAIPAAARATRANEYPRGEFLPNYL